MFCQQAQAKIFILLTESNRSPTFRWCASITLNDLNAKKHPSIPLARINKNWRIVGDSNSIPFKEYPLFSKQWQGPTLLLRSIMVPWERIELSTHCSSDNCSTSELHKAYLLTIFGSGSGNRTHFGTPYESVASPFCIPTMKIWYSYAELNRSYNRERVVFYH